MLEVDHVSKAFRNVKAVSDLSFYAREGRVIGLLGPTGAGKTTTIRMILDILQPDTGEVRWNGRRVDAQLRQTFGYLPEERGLYPKMKITEQLLFFGRLHGMKVADARQRIAELFESFNLRHNLKSRRANCKK